MTPDSASLPLPCRKIRQEGLGCGVDVPCIGLSLPPVADFPPAHHLSCYERILILTGVFLIGTLVTMLIGAFAMGRGEGFNDKYSNLLMQARTVCQGGTVLSLVLLFLTGGMGN